MGRGVARGEPTLDDELNEPTCQAGLIALSKPSSGGQTRLVFTNPDSRARERMTVRLSEDGGATWPKKRLIHAGSTGYSAPAEMPGDTVGLLYEIDNYGAIAFEVIPLDQWD